MNIRLQPRTREHVKIYFSKTQDAQIQAMIPQSVQTEEQALELFRKTLLPDATSFGLTVYYDERYVGDIWCYCINTEDTPNAMLSYCIFEKSLWGQGIATEAVRLFLDTIQHRFSFKSIGAFTYCSNVPSMRVLEKCGFSMLETFEEEGVLSAYYQKELEEFV